MPGPQLDLEQLRLSGARHVEAGVCIQTPHLSRPRRCPRSRDSGFNCTRVIARSGNFTLFSGERQTFWLALLISAKLTGLYPSSLLIDLTLARSLHSTREEHSQLDSHLTDRYRSRGRSTHKPSKTQSAPRFGTTDVF